MDEIREQAKALLESQDGSQGALVANRVYDPLVFSPDLIQFTQKQYVFLHSYRLGVPLEDAALKAHLTVSQAEYFLAKPKTRAWLADRALKDHIKREWEEPGKWWELGNAVLEGRRDLTKAQQIVFQEFGQRIVPKRQEVSASGTKIEININPDSVKEAFRRQGSIEGELA